MRLFTSGLTLNDGYRDSVLITFCLSEMGSPKSAIFVCQSRLRHWIMGKKMRKYLDNLNKHLGLKISLKHEIKKNRSFDFKACKLSMKQKSNSEF